MSAAGKKKPSDLRDMARNLIDKIDDTQILASRRLADDTKRLRILEMRKELDSIVNPEPKS